MLSVMGECVGGESEERGGEMDGVVGYDNFGLTYPIFHFYYYSFFYQPDPRERSHGRKSEQYVLLSF